MGNDATKVLNKVVRIDAAEIRGHWDEVVRGTVEETLNALLNAEADEVCKAQRYERSPDRVDTRAGSYKRKPHAKAGGVGGNCRNCASRHLGPRSVNAIAVLCYSRPPDIDTSSYLSVIVCCKSFDPFTASAKFR